VSLPKPQPLFCADFDDQPFPLPWKNSEGDGGQLRLDRSAFRSAPNSVAVQDVAGGSSVALRTPFPKILPPPALVTFSFSIQPAGVSFSANSPRIVVAAIDFLDGAATPNRYSLQFTLVAVRDANAGPSGTALSLALEEQSSVIGCKYISHPLAGALMQDMWTDVHLTVNRSGPPTATAHVWFGSTDKLFTLCKTVNAVQLQIGIGSIYKSDPASIWKNRYDNITLDIASGP
jgi:hypothetical protein